MDGSRLRAGLFRTFIGPDYSVLSRFMENTASGLYKVKKTVELGSYVISGESFAEKAAQVDNGVMMIIL